MYEPKDILQAAQAIRPQLDELLGTDAKTVAPELDKLLAQAEAGQTVTYDIIELLSDYKATRQAMDARLSNEETKNYSPF
jgi:hypothetical protein